MGENITKNSSAEHKQPIWVLALRAPSRSTSPVRPQQRRKKKSHVNETKNDAMLGYALIINQGQDIEEMILTYLQNSINSSANFNGQAWMGTILSATGSVLNTENSLASEKGSYGIISLGGTYIISEDGQVQQCGPLTISCVGPSFVVYGGQVLNRLVAVGDVQVVVGVFAHNPSVDEVKN